MKKIIKNIIYAITIIIWISIIIKLNNAIKSNDDWAPYTLKTYNDKYILQSDIYNLRDVKKEITEIANKYKKEVKLTYIEYNFEAGNKGTVSFELFKNDKYQKSTIHKITIKVDIRTKEVLSILYEKGHGKRINPYTNEIIYTLDENISDYIDTEAINYKIIVTDQNIRKYTK